MLIILIAFSAISYSQSNIRTWTETTVQDFSDDQLLNLVITNNSGGEVQFAHPLIKITEDNIDNSVHRFIERDSSGSFVRARFQSGNVYLDKYSEDGRSLLNSVQVNEQGENPHNDYDIKVAILKDGISIVIWRCTNFYWYGQIFSKLLTKVGSSFRLNESVSEYQACVFADNANHSFGIIYSLNLTTNYKLFFQKRDSSGNKTTESVYLNPDYITKYEFGPTAVSDDKGFWVAWDGADGNSTYDSDLYMRRYTFNGEPIGNAFIVNDNLLMLQGGADLAIDSNSNLFVVWIDERDGIEPITSGQLNIYGQIFNSDGIKIGSNLKLNSFGNRKENTLPDVDYNNGEYKVSWRYWDETYRRYLILKNSWRLEPKDYGEIKSSIFMTDPNGSKFNKIFWKHNNSNQAQIKFKLRTGKTLDDLEESPWYGPTDTLGFYTNSVGENIYDKHYGDNYIQYKAYLYRDSNSSPQLNEVSITYSVTDTISPSEPTNLLATSNHSAIKLSWDKNKENDLMAYNIYRRTEGENYNEDNKFIVQRHELSFIDVSATTGIVYFYVIVAIDSAGNKSDYSNEVYAESFGLCIYVSENGQSIGEGTIDKPFRTIEEGMKNAFYGDTIKILPGSYKDPFTMKEGISLIGSNAEECKINVLVEASNESLIQGLTFTKSIRCSSASPIITENIFKGAFDSYSPAIYLEFSSNPVISKNFITDCDNGIIIYNSKPAIQNNIILVNSVGINLESSATIINNTIIANRFAALNLNSPEKSVIENNILVTLDENAIAYPRSNPDNNLTVFNNFWNKYKTNTIVSSLNTFLDPQFVNIDLQDYHLSETSPCKNAGHPNVTYNDADGSRNDLGAYGGPDPINGSLSSSLIRSIYVSSQSGYPGDTVSVYISLDKIVGLAKAEFVLEYDNSILEFQRAELTQATKDFVLSYSLRSQKEIWFSLSNSTPLNELNKNVLLLKFVVNPNSKPNDASSLSLKEVFLMATNLKKIDLRSITDGAFLVNTISESENMIFVDSKFTGKEDGRRNTPFNTVTEGINKAKEGDTVFVYGGDYNEPIIMKEGIHLIGSGASVTKLIFSFDNMALGFYNIKNAEVSGFTIKTDNTHFFTPMIECISSSPLIKNNRFEVDKLSDDFISLSKGSSAILENNFISNVAISISNSNPIIKNNIVENIGCGIGSEPLILNNIFTGLISGEPFGAYRSKPVLRNNLIYCSGGGIGISLIESDSSKIYNNLVIDKSLTGTGIKLINTFNSEIINNSLITGGKGIEEIGSVATYYNNIVVNNNNFGLSLSLSSSYNYNDVWNNYTDYLGISPGSNDISANPLFVDTAKGDYRLSFNSPCKNAGHPDAKYNNPDGSRNDIGAFGGPFADSTSLNSSGSSLSIDSLNASSSDTIIVSISGKDLKDVLGLELALSFDPAILKFINANAGSTTKSFALQKSNLDNSSVNLSLTGSKSLQVDNGELINLVFKSKLNSSMNTTIHFDSAKIKDGNTFVRNIFNLKDGNIKITSGINNSDDELIPKNFALYQNFPNPFNPTTKIRFDIPTEGKVTLKVFDILGREVTTLINEIKKPGSYEIDWNAGKLSGGFSSGVYFYQLSTADFVQTRKMILMK